MKKLTFYLATMMVFFLFSCISIDSENEEKKEKQKVKIDREIDEDLEEAKEDFNSALENLGDAIEGLKKKHNVDEKQPMNFRELKEALPNRLAGLSLEESEGQTSSILGFGISTVKAEYQDDESTMEVSIVDVAGVGKLVKSMATWSEFKVDKESKDGYERTTEIDGFPALEKYNERREEGEISVLAKDRLIISVKGEDVSERQMRRAVDGLRIRRLVRLAEKAEKN